MNAEILKKVKEIVASQLGKEESEVADNASFIDDLGADSLDTMELVLALEDEFDIKIEDEDAEKLKTVTNAVEYIEKHK